MTESLTLDRFRSLAEAYGGVIARWPETVRIDALRMAAEPAARAVLDQANMLDATLDAWTLPQLDTAMIDQIVRTLPARPVPMLRRAKLWWAGVGIATALAGAAAGSVAAAVVAPADQPSDHSTAFGDVGSQGD